MRNLLFLFIFSLALLITVAPAFPAALSINLVGKWQGTISGVSYDSGSQSFQYYTGTIITRILDQNGDRFYGETSTDGGQTYGKFTGVISGGKGISTWVGGVGTADMPFLEAGAWRMNGHWQSSESNGNFNTGKCTTHRVSTTP